MARRKKYTHDQLIERTARVAAEQGADEASCPYIYDLKARKIWLRAYKAHVKTLKWAKEMA